MTLIHLLHNTWHYWAHLPIAFRFISIGSVAADKPNVSDTTNITESKTISIIGPTPRSFSVSDTTNVTDTANGVIALQINAVVDVAHVIEDTLSNPVDTNGVLDISGGTASSGETSQQHAQQFIAYGTSIISVQIKLLERNTPTDNVVVDITSSIGGTSLGSKSIATASLSSGSMNTFTFASPIAVTAGNQYFIQVSRSGVRDTTNRWSWYIYFGQNTYTGNDIYTKDNNVWSVDSTITDTTFAVTFAGNPTIAESASPISVSDTTTMSESVSMLEAFLPVSVSDTTNVTESVTMRMFSFISVSDTSNITEALTFTGQSPFNVSDTTAISESVTMFLVAAPPVTFNVSDTTNLSENVSLIIANFPFSTSDTTTVTESVSLVVNLPVTGRVQAVYIT